MNLKPLLAASALAVLGVGAANAATTTLDPDTLHFSSPTFSFSGLLDAFSVAGPSSLTGTLDFSPFVIGDAPPYTVLADDTLTGLTVSLVDLGTNTTIATQTTGAFTDTFSFNLGTIAAGSYKILYSGTNNWGSYLDAAAYTVSAVPEPETYAMMLAGLCAIGFMARRRKP